MLELAVKLNLLVEHPQLAVNLDARVAVGAQTFEELSVLALAVTNQRRHHEQPCAFRQLGHLIDDLICRLTGDRRAALVAVRMTDAGPQQTQVVVDLSYRSDR